MFVESGMIKVTFGTGAAHFGKTIENKFPEAATDLHWKSYSTRFFYKNNLYKYIEAEKCRKNKNKIRTGSRLILIYEKIYITKK